MRSVLSTIIKTVILAAGLGLSAPGRSAPVSPDPNSNRALTNWLTATTSFKQAGDLIANDAFSQATAQLNSNTAEFPVPYGTMAAQFAFRLDSALKLSTNRDDPTRLHALVDLCTDLRAHKAALRLLLPPGTNAPSEDVLEEALYPWRLLESGDTKAALAQYERRLSKDEVEIWQNYYKEQIHLIKDRPANLMSAPFAIEMVKERYMKGLETQADLFGSLSELTRVLPFAKSSKDSIAVYQTILKCLDGLGDELGKDAWQEKLFTEFKSDPEVCVSVYLDRGKKAYYNKDLPTAQSFYKKVSSQYPDSQFWGDSQYGLGLVLQEQLKYDEAIAEYAKIFPSKVNDYLLTQDSSEDCANYRFKAAVRISECWEARKDFAKALDYMLQARDRYKFVSYCKDCLRSTRENVDKRLKLLQEAVKKPE
jgi:tetratricopeptide (TPR) repeat protein